MARESRYALRLPSELYEQVKTRAEQAGISMNELIVRCIAGQLAQTDERVQMILKVEGRQLITLEERVAAIERTLYSSPPPGSP